MVEIPAVYTIEEAAQALKVSTQAIIDEIKLGHLEGFRVGDQWRTTDKNISEFISSGGSGHPNRPVNGGGVFANCATDLKRVDGFSHRWPGGTIEEYHEGYEGMAKTDGIQVQVKIGIGERFAAGRIRTRVVVFLDGRPTVEFAGADDCDTSGLVASVITLRNRKHLKPSQRVPDEYRRFHLIRYNSVVTGPRAMSAMGVLVKISDLDSMISHALIRTRYRDRG